jgi:hypothetical protein
MMRWGEYEASIQMNLVPQMTSNTSPSGVASASSQYTHSTNLNRYAFHAFIEDGLWRNASFQTPLGWVQYMFSDPEIITKYTLKVYLTPSYSGREPRSWQFQKSTNGTSWTTLHTVTNQFWEEESEKTWEFNNTEAAKYYRFNITANHGDSWHTEIKRLKLFGDYNY